MPSQLRPYFGRVPIQLIAVILFAILVPSLLVTSFGILGVYWAERFVQERFSSPIQGRLDEVFARVSEEWGAWTRLQTEYLGEARRRTESLGDLSLQDPFVRDFLVEEEGKLEWRPEAPLARWGSVSHDEELQLLVRLEQVDGDGPGMLEEARRLLAESRDPGVQAEALLAAARAEQRLQDLAGAERYLRLALEAHGQSLDSTGLLRSVPILWGLIDVCQKQGEATKVKDLALRLSLELARYERVLHPEVYRRYVERVLSLGVLSVVPATRSELARELGRVLGTLPIEALAARLPRSLAPGAVVSTWIDGVGAEELDFASFRLGARGAVVHLLLDRPRLLESFTRAAQDMAGLPPEGFRFGRESPGVNLEGASFFRRAAPPPLSHLGVAYAPVPGMLPGGFRGFNVISVAAFSWAVIVLVLAIIVGVIFTIRIVLRETRTARLKTDFISFITHELKTPLTSIRMLAETVLEGKTDDEEEREICTRMIHNEAVRLAKLVEQVLTYSSLEQRQREFRFVSCSIESVVREAVALFIEHNRIEPREIEVHAVQNLSRIKLDREAMVELFLNLLSNAAKYSDKTRKITINLRETIDEICVEFIDRGVGIRKRDQKRIFEKFYRAEDYLTRQIEGTGLGLTFARYIARVHNGEIKVSSQLNVGSTFTLQLKKTEVLGD